MVVWTTITVFNFMVGLITNFKPRHDPARFATVSISSEAAGSNSAHAGSTAGPSAPLLRAVVTGEKEKEIKEHGERKKRATPVKGLSHLIHGSMNKTKNPGYMK